MMQLNFANCQWLKFLVTMPKCCQRHQCRTLSGPDAYQTPSPERTLTQIDKESKCFPSTLSQTSSPHQQRCERYKPPNHQRPEIFRQKHWTQFHQRFHPKQLYQQQQQQLHQQRRFRHQFTFPREGKAFLARQENLRKADKVPGGAELIFLLPSDRSRVIMDLAAAVIISACALFTTSFYPVITHEILLLELAIVVALLFFVQHRMSKMCQRIYFSQPNTYYAVLPRNLFFPNKVVEFQGGDLQLTDGVFNLNGKRMYCGGRFFKSLDHIENMLGQK